MQACALQATTYGQLSEDVGLEGGGLVGDAVMTSDSDTRSRRSQGHGS